MRTLPDHEPLQVGWSRLRYCPLCNRNRALMSSRTDPFLVLTCAACGFVHRLMDEDEQRLAGLRQPSEDLWKRS